MVLSVRVRTSTGLSPLPGLAIGPNCPANTRPTQKTKNVTPASIIHSLAGSLCLQVPPEMYFMRLIYPFLES